jgi:hypothetical protein
MRWRDALPARSTLALMLTAAFAPMLAGCGNWNLEQASFDDYTAYAASTFAHSAPASVVPHSARKIHVQYNIDTTEAIVEFDFDAGDEDGMVAPFLSPDMLRGLSLQQHAGGMPMLPRPASLSLVRCGEPAVEFLHVEHHTHAKYWTVVDHKLWPASCTTGPTTPLSSA